MRKQRRSNSDFDPELDVKTFHDFLSELDTDPLEQEDRGLVLHLAGALWRSWDLGFQDIYAAKDSYVVMYLRILKSTGEPSPLLESIEKISPEFSWHVVSVLYEIGDLQPLLESFSTESLIETIQMSLLNSFDRSELLSDEEYDLNRLTLFELILGKTLENPLLRDELDGLLGRMKECANRAGLLITTSSILTYSKIRSELVRGLRSAKSKEEASDLLDAF